MAIKNYDKEDFIWNPGRPSRASLGWCSRCVGLRRAEFSLLTGNRSRWALCRLHAKLYERNREIEGIREALREPAFEKLVLEQSEDLSRWMVGYG